MVRKLRTVTLEKKRGELVELPRRRNVLLEADLTRGESLEVDPAEVADAMVKVRVLYRRGDEAAANKLAAEIADGCRRSAYHVFRPELVPVGAAATRMPELTNKVTPLEAVDMWLKERAPDFVDRTAVWNVLEGYLRRLPESGQAREQFLPFVIRAVGGRNFQPFKGAFEVSGIPDGVFEVTGKYVGAAGRSNRAGKSAFMETVLFVLQGVARKVRSLDKYVHQGEGDMSAYVELINHEGRQIRVERTIKDGATSVLIDGVRYKVSEGDEYIRQNIVGLGVADSVRIWFVRQDDLHGLLGQTSAEIQKDLMRWFGVGVWQQVEALVADDQDEKEKRAVNLAAWLKTLVSNAELNQVDEDDVRQAREELEEVEAGLGGLAQAELDVGKLVDRLTISRKIAAALVAVQDRRSVESRAAKLEDEQVRNMAKLDGLVMKVGAVTAKIREAQSNLATFDGVCPVDSGKCPRAKDINRNEEKIQKIVFKLCAERDGLQEQVSEMKDAKARLDSERRESEETARKIRQAQEVLDEYGSEPEHEPDIQRDLQKARARLEAARGHEGDIRRRVNELRGTLTSLEASRKIRERALQQIGEAEEEQKQLEADLRVLRYARLMVGRAGIPTMQIENAVGELEAQANAVLQMIGTEHRLSFSFETELKRKASACHECGRPFDSKDKNCAGCGAERGKEKSDQLTVVVTEGGREFSFDQDSGGGKALLAMAARIALAKMLGAVVIAADEVCASLDRENLTTYLTMLRTLTSIGIRQVFDVSHRPEVAEALDRNIVVTRYPDQGCSTVGWE